MSMDDVQGIIRTSPFLVDYHKNLTEMSHENRFEKVPARKHLESRRDGIVRLGKWKINCSNLF